MILARSPFILKVEPADPADTIDYTVLDVYIWVGDKVTDKPVVPSFTLRKDKSAIGNFNAFDISPLVSDFVSNSLASEADGYYQSNAFWVEYDAEMTILLGGTESWTGNSTTLATDGFTELGRGSVNTNNPSLLQSSTNVRVLADELVRIPVLVDESTAYDVYFYNDSELLGTYNVATDDDSTTMIKYITQQGVVNYSDFRGRVERDSGTFEDSNCNYAFFDTFVWGGCNRIVVGEGADSTEITIDYVSECKYKVYKCIFTNKFGALQDFYFFKKSMTNLTIKDEILKASPSDEDFTYTNTDFFYNRFNVDARESMKLNTGFIHESENQTIKELILSKAVWLIDIEEDFIMPVVVNKKSIELKQSVNDKLINYDISFDLAYDLISTFV